MIFFHVSYHDGQTLLWSEAKPDASLSSHELHHPFDEIPVSPLNPGRKKMAQTLEKLFPKWNFEKRSWSWSVSWLPSIGDEPIPSSPLLGRRDSSEKPKAKKGRPARSTTTSVQIQPFAVTSYSLTSYELLVLSELACDDEFSMPGVFFGDSLRWCAHLMRHAINLGRTGAILPHLAQTADETKGRCQWLAYPDEVTEQSLHSLAESLPASCRCLSSDASAAPEIHPQTFASLFLNEHLTGLCQIPGARDPISSKTNRTALKIDIGRLHDLWIAGLTDARCLLKTDESALIEMSQRLSNWRMPIDRLRRAPFRLCIRMEEPEPDAPEHSLWRLSLHIQAKWDPSLMLPLPDFWRNQRGSVAQLSKNGANPSNFIYTALGQAAGIYPPLLVCLERPDPWGIQMDTHAVVEFLRVYSPPLRDAGFTLMLPSWWIGGHARRLSLKATAKSPLRGSGQMSLDSLVDFQFKVALGDQELSAAELKALAKLKSPLIRVRGQWFQVEDGQIQTALRFLEKRERQPMAARELIGLALGSPKLNDDLALDSVETDGWMSELLERLSGREPFAELEQPKGFVGQLRPYQLRGFSWMAFLRRWRLGACLADDMGLGKTVQTLALLQHERANGERRPNLLVCPTSVVNNWRREAERFAPELPVFVHHGSDRIRHEAFIEKAKQHALVISSYGLLQRDLEFLITIDWAGMIIDEAQNIKNPDTKQAQAARLIKSDYRIALTGTPVENHVGDLWSLMDFLNPGLIGTKAAFKTHFFQPIQMFRDEQAMTRLKTLTGPFVLRRLKTDRKIIDDLPEKVESKEYCTLTREQASLYQAVVDDVQLKMATADGIARLGLVLTSLLKLKQVCNHPALFLRDGSSLEGRSGKFARLLEMLDEIREMGERTLVFTQFAEMAGLIQRYLEERNGEEVFLLHGGTNRTNRDRMVERFQNDPDAPYVFVLSLKAGGTGLNLTRANQVIHFDRWWNPAVENQASDRTFRIGQRKNVQVHKFIVAGTLEERIDDLITRKTDIATGVVGEGEAWLGQLTNEELRALIALGGDALEE